MLATEAGLSVGGNAQMQLSFCGAQMTRMSGLRSIMEDVAVTTGATEQWLNLGIGNPALIPEAVAMWRRLTEESLASHFIAASCQYGPSRGTRRLIDSIAAYFGKTYGWDITAKNIVVGPGSQMLCFIAAALFAGPGPAGRRPVVLPRIPDYAGYQGLCINADGVNNVIGVPPIIRLAEGRQFQYVLDREAVRERSDIGLMLLSSPCNPTGACIDADDVGILANIGEMKDCVVVVDHAYGAPFPQIVDGAAEPIWHEQVINCFSISKAGLPGERIGFAIGASRYIDAMVSFIANTSLHAPQFPQAVLAQALDSGCLDDLTTSVIKPYYLARRDTAECLLYEILPGSIDWHLHASRGGMFCWVWVDEPWFDDTELYYLLKLKKVVIAPGRYFFTYPLSLANHGIQCFRISVTVDESALRDGIEHIAEGLQELQCRHAG
jgi:valine--pyruvate aminotransferase